MDEYNAVNYADVLTCFDCRRKLLPTFERAVMDDFDCPLGCFCCCFTLFLICTQICINSMCMYIHTCTYAHVTGQTDIGLIALPAAVVAA